MPHIPQYRSAELVRKTIWNDGKTGNSTGNAAANELDLAKTIERLDLTQKLLL